jgi:hypothetical protein
MSALLSEKAHFVMGLAPVADAFSGSVYSDVICVKNWRKVMGVIVKGVALSATATITVEAGDAASPTTVTAIPFKYRAITSGDTVGALTDATAAAGFATTAGSSQLYLIEIDCAQLAGLGLNWIRIKSAELVDSPALGGMLLILTEPRKSVDTDNVIA